MTTITDEEIHEVFTAFDTDGTGNLSMAELSNALNLLGIDLTEEELADTYRIDDDPATLTEEELRLYVQDRIGKIDFKNRCIECFKEFDESGTGLISSETMKVILTQRGSHPMDEESAEELMKEFINKDGQFNIEEISRLLYAQQGLEDGAR